MSFRNPRPFAAAHHEDTALSVQQVNGLGKTFVATKAIASGTLLVREAPVLAATPLYQLPPSLRKIFEAGAETLAEELGPWTQIDDLLIIHAFARSSPSIQRTVLAENCGPEVCPSNHPLIAGARRTAAWCRGNDPACADMDLATLTRAICVFSLNAFSFLAQGAAPKGVTSLFPRGAKFTHRCLKPSIVFHSQSGAMCFRAIRDIPQGQVPTISYLGSNAQCGAPRRRKILHESKGFTCACEDCSVLPDAFRQMPCPGCCGARDGQTGLLSNGALVVLSDALAQVRLGAASSEPGVDVTNQPSGPVANSATRSEVLPAMLRHLTAATTPASDSDDCPPLLPGVWRCDRCGVELTDADMDVACRAPQAGVDWRSAKAEVISGSGGSVTGADGTSATRWPLQLPPGGLFEWEAQLETAVQNLQRMQLEVPMEVSTDASSGESEATTSAPDRAATSRSLRMLPAFLDAVVSIVGPGHWLTQALLEMQLDHWMELAMAVAPPKQMQALVGGELEQTLITQLRSDASCQIFANSRELFEAAWARIEFLWRLRQIRGEHEHWEVLHEVLEALDAWGLRDAVLPKDSDVRKRAMHMVAAMRAQTALEFGNESEDASEMRQLELAIAGL